MVETLGKSWNVCDNHIYSSLTPVKVDTFTQFCTSHLVPGVGLSLGQFEHIITAKFTLLCISGLPGSIRWWNQRWTGHVSRLTTTTGSGPTSRSSNHKRTGVYKWTGVLSYKLLLNLLPISNVRVCEWVGLKVPNFDGRRLRVNDFVKGSSSIFKNFRTKQFSLSERDVTWQSRKCKN